MKVSKKAIKVKLEWKEEPFISYRSEYKCPKCKATFQGFVRDRNTTRFLCECGQELIIDKEVDNGEEL